MPKSDSKGRSKNGYSRFNIYDYGMTLSEAFLSLSGDAVKVFMPLRTRYTEDKHKVSNNGNISYGIREGKEIYLSKDRIARALKELQKKGFLKVKDNSTFDQKKMARTWIITCEKYANKQPTRDFKNYKPDPVKKQNTVAPVRQHSRTSATPTPEKPVTVAPVRLIATNKVPLQSHQCDTYIYTTGGGKKNGIAEIVNANDEHTQANPENGIARRSGVTTYNEASRAVFQPEKNFKDDGWMEGKKRNTPDLIELKKRTSEYLFNSGYGSHQLLSEKIGVKNSKLSRFINKPQSTLPDPVVSKLIECISGEVMA